MRTYGFIPPEDQERIAEIYNITPHPRLKYSAEDFVLCIEAALVATQMGAIGPPEVFVKAYVLQFKPDLEHTVYKGFIDDETHISLVDLGVEWDEEKRIFEGLSSDEYELVRTVTLHNLARHATHVFSDYNGKDTHEYLGKKLKVRLSRTSSS